MIQLQLDVQNVFGEITPGIACAHMQSGDTESLALCLDDHSHLLFNGGYKVSLESSAVQNWGERR
jgi:hypothetical protein